MAKEKKDWAKSLKGSARNKAAMLKKYGFIPMSVLEIRRGNLDRSMYHYRGDTGGFTGCDLWHYKDKEAIDMAKGSPPLAATAAELVEFFIKYYVSKKNSVFLDPFMGRGVPLQIAKRLGLDYYGYDLSSDFCRYVNEVIALIDDGKTVLKAIQGDSRSPDQIPDGIGDFCFTSPPYWNTEYYGDEKGQLGKNSYEGFLVSMEEVARAWMPKFKSDAIAL